jgi:class 3 adenylate cyclase
MAAVRGLIVILAADVAGYASLVGADEEGTLERLKEHRQELVDPKVEEHRGRIVRATGGSLLVEFASPAEAVRCAVDLQRGMIDRNLRTAPDRRIAFRVGINIGAAATFGDDLVSRAVAALPIDQLASLIKPCNESFDEAGNIAMRIAALADPARICISEAVWDTIRDQLPFSFGDIGKHDIGIRAAPVRCYAMSADSAASRPRSVVSNSVWFRHPSPNWRMRKAALAASVAGTVGVWAIALWAWLGANLSPVPIPTLATAERQDSRTQSVSSVPNRSGDEPSVPSPPLASSMAADSDTQAPLGKQPSLASTTDSSIRPSSPQPTLLEIGAAAVRGKQAPAPVQTTPDSGPVVIKGNQAPSARQITPDSSTLVVKGYHAPSSLHAAANAGTDVLRGTRAPSGPSFSIVALPLEHPPSTHPEQE